MTTNEHPAASEASRAARTLPAIAGRDFRVSDGQSPLWRSLAFCSTSAARSLVSYPDAVRLQALPLSVRQNPWGPCLTAALATPTDPATLKELSFLSGAEVVAEGAPAAVVRRAIQAAYRGEGARAREVVDAANANARTARPPASTVLTADELLTALIERALFLGASDVHLEPRLECAAVRFRVFGRLEEERQLELTPGAMAQLVRRIKILAGIDPTGIPRPEEGGFQFRPPPDAVRIRLSSIPVVGGEKVVLRLLGGQGGSLEEDAEGGDGTAADPGATRLLSVVPGLTPEQAALLELHLSADRGAILLSGPTGSGKSTLLYAALRFLNRPARNITTLEDPVERVLSGINQVEARPEAGLGFKELLPRLLRQDPDVVMIGEIRDREVLEASLGAAMTGSLVLSTIHAGTCLELLARVRHLGASPAEIAEGVRLVTSQRLLAINCSTCAEARTIPPLAARLFGIDPAQQVFEGRGCAACRETGAGGRRAVFEMLLMTEAIRRALALAPNGSSALPLEALERAAVAQGYRSYLFAVRDLLLQGAISPAAALRAAGLWT